MYFSLRPGDNKVAHVGEGMEWSDMVYEVAAVSEPMEWTSIELEPEMDMECASCGIKMEWE